MIKSQPAQNVTIQTLPAGYCINQQTGKLIKIGSKKYNELLKSNLIEAPTEPIDIPKPKGKNIVAETTSRHKALLMKKQLQEANPVDGKVYAISNDQNKVVLRNKKSPSVKPQQMIDLVSQSVYNVNKKLAGKDVDEDDQEQLEMIKQLLAQEMIALKKRNNNVVVAKKRQLVSSDVENDDDEISDHE